jgi:hypothetical protein
MQKVEEAALWEMVRGEFLDDAPAQKPEIDGDLQ